MRIPGSTSILALLAAIVAGTPAMPGTAMPGTAKPGTVAAAPDPAREPPQRATAPARLAVNAALEAPASPGVQAFRFTNRDGQSRLASYQPVADPDGVLTSRSHPWPTDRAAVMLGTLSLHLPGSAAGSNGPILFGPANPVRGISPVDEPIPPGGIRAYSISAFPGDGG